ncbi:MAG: hypothetical protein JNL67_08585 [Planctomycetaceae bacterium]|nr:hypothetical protein [Planctomycetaceae bacterium]
MNRSSQIVVLEIRTWILGVCLVFVTRVTTADDFAKNIAPVLNQNCVACHNAKTSEGGLNLESFEKMMLGGDSGAAIVAGDPDGSELLARVRAADDSVMPPVDNSVGAKPLTEQQIEWLSAWIRAGATPPTAGNERAIQWRTISESIRPVYALRTSGDGHYLSFAKGNVAYVVANPFAEGSWNPVPLLDPSLTLSDGSPLSATDKDLVHALAFSHDSQKLAVGGFRTVKLWQRQTGASLTEATESNRQYVSTQGGTWRVAQDDEKRLLVLSNDSPDVLHTLGPMDTRISSAVWSKDHAALWVLGDGNQLWCWRREESGDQVTWNMVEVRTVEPLADALSLLMTDAQQLMVITKAGQVHKLIEDGAMWRSELAFAIDSTVRLARSSSDGRLLVTVDAQNVASLWSLASGQKLHVFGMDYERWQAQQATQRQLARQEAWIKRLSEAIPGLEEAIKKEEEARTKVAEAHQKAVEAQTTKEQEIAMAQQAVTETEQGIAALEQQLAEKKQQLAEKQKAVADLQPQLSTAQQNVSKAMQALASADAGLQLARDRVPAQQSRIETHRLDLAQHQQALEKFSNSTRGEILAATFDSLAQQVLLLTETGHGLLYQTTTGQPAAVLHPPTTLTGSAADSAANSTMGRVAELEAMDGQTATARMGSATWQWNLELPWELVQTWGNENENLFSSRVTALAFSPDDRVLAVGSGPPSRFGDLKEMDVATGAVKRDYGQVHSDTILAVEYSPDGKWLATAGADKLCRLHDPQTGAMVKILEGHTHFVQSLSWQNQAQQLATASADKTIKTWDVETGERRQSITGFGKEISAIAYVGDTEQLISVSLDGQARMHRGDNAQLVRNYTHHPQPLYAVSLSPDGQRLIVGDHDGSIRIYQVEDSKLIRQWPE